MPKRIKLTRRVKLGSLKDKIQWVLDQEPELDEKAILNRLQTRGLVNNHVTTMDVTTLLTTQGATT